ncbi:MAG: hypothetical protein JWN70_1074 [Planctomycetaceae bacterium]|nr:hypothetical protein [Planctomycetaceae bacterium]
MSPVADAASVGGLRRWQRLPRGPHLELRPDFFDFFDPFDLFDPFDIQVAEEAAAVTPG